jgi:HD-like signal output (HDOD) protein
MSEDIISKYMGDDGSKSSFEKTLLLKRISQTTSMPAPSAHIMKVMMLLREENVRMPALVEAIERDQALVAQVLKLINSGFYGLRQTIDSVDRAVGFLGLLTVKQLVYSASIMDIFSDDEQVEWNHSYTTSVLMTQIMRENDLPAASNLPLTMIMHDLGKVALRRFSPKKYKLAQQQAVAKNIPIYQAENAIMSVNHSEVGALLLQKWDMTEDMLVPILFHHQEIIPKDYVMETALTQFVNWIDNKARNIQCEKPRLSLMQQAGFEEIDGDYWVEYQLELIRSVEDQNMVSASDHQESDTRKLQKQEQRILKNQTPELSDKKDDEIKIIPATQGMPAAVARPPRTKGRPIERREDDSGYIVLRRPTRVPRTKPELEDKPLKKDATTTVVLRRSGR